MTETPHQPPAWLELNPSERISHLGHRAYIGAQDPELWYGIGRHQYHFLVSQGLRPNHTFLDVACGSLRLGQYLIPFLESGRYFGLEAEPELVEAGLKNELLFEIEQIKKPRFGHGYNFDVSFSEQFDFAIAQSLFTHLTPQDIGTCLRNLKAIAGQQSILFYTFFEGDKENPEGPSHAQKNWYYSFQTLSDISLEAGWHADYIGDWNHARGQKIVRATIKS